VTEGIDHPGLATGADARTRSWHRLAPVSPRWPWITGGLVLQLIGAGAPIVYILNKAHHEDIGGQISRATLTLAWRQAVHSHTGLALMIAGAAVFVLGSIVMARPFVRSWVTLFVAIPIAALAGLLVLGAAAILVGLIAVGADELINFMPSGSSGGDRSSTERRRRRQPDPADADGG
jgi:hypothetical protein